jgi:hypothetical protein
MWNTKQPHSFILMISFSIYTSLITSRKFQVPQQEVFSFHYFNGQVTSTEENMLLDLKTDNLKSNLMAQMMFCSWYLWKFLSAQMVCELLQGGHCVWHIEWRKIWKLHQTISFVIVKRRKDTTKNGTESYMKTNNSNRAQLLIIR